MNRKKLIVSNNINDRNVVSEISNSLYLVFFEMHSLYRFIQVLCNLLHAKLVWMPSVCYIPNYYLLNCVYLYLEPLKDNSH